MMRGCGRALLYAVVFVVGMSTLLDMTQATDYVVGGDAQKWNYLQANSNFTWYNSVWAANKTFVSGDNLIFSYDNTTHDVLQLATQQDFDGCNVANFIRRYESGQDIVLITSGGTFFYVCGSPSHCTQGIRVKIVATGPPVSAQIGPPGPASRISPTPSIGKAPPALQSGTPVLLLITALAAYGVAVLWQLR